jgi:hypothetical protein
VLTLRGDGMPTEAERGTASGWARVAEAHPSLLVSRCLSPRSAVAGSVPVGSGSLQLPVEGLARVIFLDGATA